MSPLLKTALFTLVVPGSFAGLIPLLIAGDRAAADGAVRALGLLLLGLGGVLYLRSAWDFASFGRGTPAITDAPKRLVTRGFYRYSRNPMYVAVLSAVFGWAILYREPVLWAYAGAIFVFFSLFIRLYEEPRLTREFGDEYVAYMKRVGRWLSLPGRRDA
ncbi:MAG: isoprenylcysteine carboxylmethyltransferase family protein [Gammaproteobacteria bacterium]|nr:isoprenylcysteine carboxylmethyltransferase family protein [Gammaproteobacteria bacterium]